MVLALIFDIIESRFDQLRTAESTSMPSLIRFSNGERNAAHMVIKQFCTGPDCDIEVATLRQRAKPFT
jgi:hypothetical protein